MPLVTTREIVENARAAGGGAGAFNVISLEHVEGIIAGAETAASPVVLQISENAVRFHGGRVRPLAFAAGAAAEAAAVPVSLHLDHVEDQALLHQAVDAGFSSAMYDASKLRHADNVRATRTAAEWAHAHDLWLEAELGEIGGKDGAHALGVRTRPDEAADFVIKTGVDALAVAVGSSHAMTTQSARLDHDLIAALRDAVTVPLVLHGSSGVAVDELRQSVRHGIVKINIGTILNVAYTEAIREALAAQPQVVDPRKYLNQARDQITDVVRRVLTALNVAGP
jgi:fructose-bisphosphate aldolase class II